MLCPADSTLMRDLVVEDVALEVCDQCLRAWFDFGEYQALLPDLPRSLAGAESVLICPKCPGRRVLVKAGVPWRGTVYCQECRGLLAQLPPHLLKAPAVVDGKVGLGLVALFLEMLKLGDAG